MADAQEKFEAWWDAQWFSPLMNADAKHDLTARSQIAYLAGFAAGAEDMRERAAKECARMALVDSVGPLFDGGFNCAKERAAYCVRALPLEAEEMSR